MLRSCAEGIDQDQNNVGCSENGGVGWMEDLIAIARRERPPDSAFP